MKYILIIIFLTSTVGCKFHEENGFSHKQMLFDKYAAAINLKDISKLKGFYGSSFSKCITADNQWAYEQSLFELNNLTIESSTIIEAKPHVKNHSKYEQTSNQLAANGFLFQPTPSELVIVKHKVLSIDKCSGNTERSSIKREYFTHKTENHRYLLSLACISEDVLKGMQKGKTRFLHKFEEEYRHANSLSAEIKAKAIELAKDGDRWGSANLIKDSTEHNFQRSYNISRIICDDGIYKAKYSRLNR